MRDQAVEVLPSLFEIVAFLDEFLALFVDVAEGRDVC